MRTAGTECVCLCLFMHSHAINVASMHQPKRVCDGCVVYCSMGHRKKWLRMCRLSTVAWLRLFAIIAQQAHPPSLPSLVWSGCSTIRPASIHLVCLSLAHQCPERCYVSPPYSVDGDTGGGGSWEATKKKISFHIPRNAPVCCTAKWIRLTVRIFVTGIVLIVTSCRSILLFDLMVNAKSVKEKCDVTHFGDASARQHALCRYPGTRCRYTVQGTHTLFMEVVRHGVDEFGLGYWRQRNEMKMWCAGARSGIGWKLTCTWLYYELEGFPSTHTCTHRVAVPHAFPAVARFAARLTENFI